MIIIDGHNLIGAIKDIKLSDPKAKEKLLEKLDAYQKIMDRKILVVFDGSTIGEYELGKYNDIDIQFPTKNESADDTIKKLIEKYQNQHGVSIISSDNVIMDKAKRSHLSIQDSKSFNEEIEEAICEGNDETEKYLSPMEVDKWIDIFEKGKKR